MDCARWTTLGRMNAPDRRNRSANGAPQTRRGGARGKKPGHAQQQPGQANKLANKQGPKPGSKPSNKAGNKPVAKQGTKQGNKKESAPGAKPSPRNNRNAHRIHGRGPHRPQRAGLRSAPRQSIDPLYDLHSDLPVSVETSAGGLVLSGLAEAVQPNGDVDLSQVYVALIGRLDRRGRLLWSMPKGHIEPDESTFVTAEREVWEETGVYGAIVAELGTIDYWFVSEGVRIHKTVHHHLLRFVDGELNDEDPEVTEVQWLPVNVLAERLAYADERRLAREAVKMLPDLARAEAAAGRGTPR